VKCGLIAALLCVSLFAWENPEMVTIPAGTFAMGRTKLTSDDKTNMRPHVLLDDRPVHQVTISAFQIDRHEVTNAQYQAFVAKTGHPAPYHWTGAYFPDRTADLPVYNVDWDDAHAYCRWKGERLPTEAEWEYVARGGKDALDYPWGDQPDPKLARFNVSSGPGPVAKFPPNGFGVFDMAGNVSEWTADWFDGAYYKNSPAADPKGPETGEYRVIRGGAWSDSGRRITVFFRNWVRPNQRTPNIGFRCAR
jgi:formylglycine-generating enzyme required for sulfatase activity